MNRFILQMKNRTQLPALLSIQKKYDARGGWK